MLNEYAYCPRLFHLMHVEGRWADNHYTVDGQNIHRRVDQLDHILPNADAPPPEEGPALTVTTSPATTSPKTSQNAGTSGDGGDAPPTITRSVPLTSTTLGLTAKLDLVSTVHPPSHSDQTNEKPSSEAGDGDTSGGTSGGGGSSGGEAVPVETKRGRVPDNPQRSYEPERIQLMAQGLLLREQNYHCDHGVLYFASSRTRVDVPFTQQLETRTRQLLKQARAATQQTQLPPPLDDSPKCRGCSLNGICLPDETLALQQLNPASINSPTHPHADADERREEAPGNHPKTSNTSGGGGGGVRRLYPARQKATPLYVQEQGAYVGKSKSRLIIRKFSETLAEARLKDVSQLVLCGNIGISAQTIHLLCEAAVPIVHLSMGHWFHGITHGITLRNAFDREAQFAAARNDSLRLTFAQQLVADKAANQRTLLRRNAPSSRQLDRTLRDIDHLITRIPNVQSLAAMLGTEGAIAALYFQNFAPMLKPRDLDAQWDFNHRNRRPPKDPVNAVLSFGYALLAKECTVALLAEGLDPWWGLYHRPRHGRPSLALDLMEPFRPAIADSAVITAFNTGMLQRRNFTMNQQACMLQPAGRKNFIRAYESRLDQLVTHPTFDYRCSWRTVIKLQARLLARWLRRDIPLYTTLTTR